MRMRTRSIAWSVAITLMLVSLATATVAGAAGPLTLVSTLVLDKPVLDLVVDGNLAYVGTDVGVTIVNIANPASPQVVGQISLGGQIMGLALKGSHLYLANRSKDLQVVDVSNPSAPVLLATRGLSSYAWDVAVKEDVAYVASFGGELNLFDVGQPANPQLFKVLGIWEWTSSSQDAKNLAKLNDYVSAGNAKTTGVSIIGDTMLVTGWNYGRLFYYNVSNPASPQFRGTHYAPFLFRSEVNPQQTVAYTLAAFGNTSGVHSVPLSAMGPSFSTTQTSCTVCDYFKSVATDYGGLAVSPNGRYVVTILGKKGEVRVLDVTNPSDIKDAGSLPLPAHGMKTGEPMGVAIKGNDIFTAAGILGLRVYRFLGLTD
jgi:hypothetical protein